MDLSPRRVQTLLQIRQEPLSLDWPINDEEDLDLSDVIEDHAEQAPPNAASYLLLKEQVAGLLNRLTERERVVVTLRYGLVDGRNRTLEEVGKQFQVTRERIRQIEASALGKLRAHSRDEALQDYLD
jgi:RNA polymerase primary sigma factor